MRVQLKCSINRLVLYFNYNHITQREILSIWDFIVPGHSPSITCSLLSHSLKLILNVQCKVIIIILVHGTRLAAVFLAIPRMKEITRGIMKSFHTLLHRTRSGNRTIVHVSIKYPPSTETIESNLHSRVEFFLWKVIRLTGIKWLA